MPQVNYITFNREEWAKLGDKMPLALTIDELEKLRGINEAISLDEVRDVYLPLARLLHLSIQAHLHRKQVLEQFLAHSAPPSPYIIGIAGSVAAGKSTTARVLQTLLNRWNVEINVALATTDGFLYPNAELEKRQLMQRKGFPQSYDTRALLEFVRRVKSGHPQVKIPMYSHLRYDRIPHQMQLIQQPHVLLLEGLNVLQTSLDCPRHPERRFVSDYVDFSIFVDAKEPLLRQWYVERFQKLRDSTFRDPQSYFHHYAQLSAQEAEHIALNIWESINYPNLMENILPTRKHANLILTKGDNHTATKICLRCI